MKGINFRFERNHPGRHRLQEWTVPVAGCANEVPLYADEIPF